MVFNTLGGIYYTETYEISKLDYGGSIPCFIGRTINPSKDYTKDATELAYRAKAITELKSASTSYTGAAITEAEQTEENIQAQIQVLKALPSDDSRHPDSAAINAQKNTAKANDIAKHKINELQVFYNFDQVNRTTLTDGKLDGLGDYNTEKEQNPLLNVIHDFCEETKMMTEEYVACPYFYVIDLGMADTITPWINSIETSKIKREIDMEIYVGFEGVTDTITTNGNTSTVTVNPEDFILAVNYELYVNRQTIGDFRKAFHTKLHTYTTEEATTDTTLTAGAYAPNTYYKKHYKALDSELITLAKNLTGANNTNDQLFHTNETTGTYDSITTLNTNTISKSRTYLCEPLWYGKTVGRISITPYDMEPGYYEYNTLTSEDIILRRPNERLQLQMAGVIFNQLEETSANEYVKINRTQSVSSNLTTHPPDSLYQSRHLTDELITKLFDAVYPQIKNKETETNIAYLQTQINKIVNDAIAQGDFVAPYMVNNERKGTFFNLQESSEDAYDLEVIGMAQPVNCTYSIHIIAQINDARIKVTNA